MQLLNAQPLSSHLKQLYNDVCLFLPSNSYVSALQDHNVLTHLAMKNFLFVENQPSNTFSVSTSLSLTQEAQLVFHLCLRSKACLAYVLFLGAHCSSVAALPTKGKQWREATCLVGPLDDGSEHLH